MIALLGATGNVGGKIAARLANRNEPIRVIARSPERLRGLVGRSVTAFAGDINNREFLARALAGADAVFTLIPPNPQAPDFLRYADSIGESIARAIETAGVKQVVNLSSVGADLGNAATGPIRGLYGMEKRLNGIKGLHVVHVRAAYFMENLLMNIDLINSQGIAGSAVRGDLKFAMIAAKDIAQHAADRLSKRDFLGSSVQYLLGERDLTLSEASGIIGKKIGKPGLQYVTFPYEDAEKAMISMGLSPDMSRSYVDMARAFNDGTIKAEARSRANTTPTSIETFCDEVFVPAFNTRKAA